MNDLISRSALLEDKVFLCGGFVGDEYAKGYMEALDKVEETIKNAPTVEPVRGEWIPVSERLPEKDGYFLITTSDNEIDIREYLYSKGWGWDGFERVIAWQPLPEPYRKDVE